MPKSLHQLLLGSLAVLLGMFSAAIASEGTINDTARFLAGMLPSEGSPLIKLTQNPLWKSYARRLDKSWTILEKDQLSKVRAFAATNLTHTEPTLIYFFSGPDFLYSQAFFPNATNYILAGLEPVGDIPDLNRLSQREIAQELGELERSINSISRISFFITKKMSSDLAYGQVRGTLPILLLFMARAGVTINDIVFVNLDGKGGLAPTLPLEHKTHSGVKISFSGSDGLARTLYYFSTELSNSGFRRSGLMEFCTSLGASDAFIKSASYLLHSNDFSMVRTFLKVKTSTLLQDDTGIPVRYLDIGWDLRPFGTYLTPISLFPGTYQKELAQVYRKNAVGKLDFGIGYRWQSNQSNLLLAEKHKDTNPQSSDPIAAVLEIPPTPPKSKRPRTVSKSRGNNDFTFKIFNLNFLPL